MPRRRRVLTIVLALLAAGGFAVAAEGGHWWDLGGGVHISLTGTERCFDGDCGVGALGWTGGSGLWERAGVGAYVGSLCAALVLVALAGAVAARRAGRLAAAVVAVATATTTAAGVGFVAMAPAIPGAALGRGVIIFAVGVVLAIAAVIATITAPRAG